MANVIVKFTCPGTVSGNHNSTERFNNACVVANGPWLEIYRELYKDSRIVEKQLAVYSQRYLVSAIVEHDDAT